jgi:hypothetical protein
MVEHLPRMCKALGSIFSTEKKKEGKLYILCRYFFSILQFFFPFRNTLLASFMSIKATPY